MTGAIVVIIVGLALMLVGWLSNAGDLSNVLFIVGLVLAVIGVFAAVTRRF